MNEPIMLHFYASEFACHDGTPYPPEWISDRLRPLCAALERLRAELGDHPIRIVSGYRTLAHNTEVGGALHSQHMLGRAADIEVEGIAPPDVHAAARRLWCAGELQIGGLGLYPGWVHVDVRQNSGHLAEWTGAKVGDEVA